MLPVKDGGQSTHSIYVNAKLPEDLPPGRYQAVFDFVDYRFNDEGERVPNPTITCIHKGEERVLIVKPTIPGIWCNFQVPEENKDAAQDLKALELKQKWEAVQFLSEI